jgi:benzoylformate decarboxylase
MKMREITANAAHIMVEQLAALDVKFVFNNSGSREALFFDALHAHSDIHGILALHEGSVAAMAGGYTQVKLEPAVMVVHLGAGLSQCLGQLINVWSGGLPVVVITFAGDTGSYADKVGLDLNHNFGPTSISAPFTKENWTVIEPEGLPAAIHRALQVAKTPPVGTVHIAAYDRVLRPDPITTRIIEGGLPGTRAGCPADSEIEEIACALHDAERPLLYFGDGVWKSGATQEVIEFAEHFGLPMVGDTRSISIKNPLHCGRLDQAVSAFNPDYIICLGVRQGGGGRQHDFGGLARAERIIAIGPGVDNFKNIPNLDVAILADELRTVERLNALARSDSTSADFDDRRAWAKAQAATIRTQERETIQRAKAQQGTIRPFVVAQVIDAALERLGGGLVMIEQYVVPLGGIGSASQASNNVYIRAAGGSEGYGIGGAIGVKLAAPDKPVVGLVGDGSMYYADSGLWTAAHHNIPILYVISNNQSYGVVAGSFGRADGVMKQTGEYAGVVLDGIDPVKIAEGFGVEGAHVQDESHLTDAINRGLKVVEGECRPFLLNVHLPLGLPEGGRAATPFHLGEIDERKPDREI